MWVKRGSFVELCLKDNSIIYGRVDDIIIDKKRWKMGHGHSRNTDG